MKTTIRFFASSAAAALALALSAAAAGNYTLAWGGNDDAQLDIPANVHAGATRIAASAHHTIAIVGGRIVGWGAPDDGALDYNSGIQNIEFIASGENSGVAINAYGGAAFWGGNTNYNFRNDFPGNDPMDYSVYVSAALGRDHGLLLTEEGAVKAWGAPESSIPVTTPSKEWTSGFTAVAAGRNFSLGLSNGVVHVAAPTNDIYKLLEIPDAATRIDPRTRKGPVTAIAAGPYHAMALTTNGEVLVWGAWTEEDGEDDDPIDDSFWSNAVAKVRAPLPRNSYGNVTNVPPAALSGVKAIAAGYNLCAALTESGAVLVWGMERGTGAVLSEIPPYASRDIREIAVGFQHVAVRSSWLPPEFTGDTLPEAHLESEYSATVPVHADPAATITVRDSRFLPPGISLAPDGTFSGIPTALGTNTFQVVASNSCGVATKTFTIVVSERLVRPPQWITESLPPAVVGFPYGYPGAGFQLEATESPSFSADAQLPAWLSLSSSGLLTGTPAPADVGSAYPTFTAANSAGSANALFQLLVNPQSADTPPVIGLDAIPDLLVDTPSSIDLQIAGATSVSLSGDLAADFRIVSSNGVWLLSGTPSSAIQGDGRTAVVVAVNSAASATNEYLVSVKGPPRWATSSLPPAAVGTPYSATLAADWAASYEISSSSLRPIPLSLSVVTNADSSVVAVLSGTPTNTVKTSFAIPVTAQNAFGPARHTFTLSLSDVVPPDYRFLSIAPTGASLVLSWTNLSSPDLSATLVSTTNLLAWPSSGTPATPPVTLPRPAVPTFYRLQEP